MIQKGTYINIVDNSGAKKALCIHIYGGYRKKYASVGDLILITVKTIKKKKAEDMKIQKGEISKALIVSTKSVFNNVKYPINSAILITNQNKYLGTRVFIPISKKFRSTKYIKIISISTGVIN